MKLSEISELEDCKNQCPLYGEYCNGGTCCYGGAPIEPPCVNHPDEDADEYYRRKIKQQLEYDKWEDGQLKKKEAKEEKLRIAKQKRHEYKMRNYKEVLEIRQCQKRIRAKQKLMYFEKSFIFAVNATNKMFRESGCDCPSDIRQKNNYQLQIDDLNNRITELKSLIKQNEKFYKKKCAITNKRAKG